MRNRIAIGQYILMAVLFFFCSVGIGALVFFSGPVSVLHDVASAARMPIPGTADVKLEARDYGLYFGMLNAPTGKVMNVPKLNITIVPPDGIADPKFVEVTPATDVLVDGFHTSQVARITVTAPGKYHVQVESPDENGGSFSIGEMPATVDALHNVLRAAPGIILFLGLSFLMVIAALFSALRRKA